MSRSIQTRAWLAILIFGVSCSTAPKKEQVVEKPILLLFGYPTDIPVEYMSKELDASESRKVWDAFCVGKSARRSITLDFDYILPAPAPGNAAKAGAEMTRLKRMLPLAVKRFFSTKMKTGNPYLGSIVDPKDFGQLVSSTPRGRMELDEDDRPYTPFSDYAKYTVVEGTNRVIIFWSNIDHRIMPILEKDESTYFEKLSDYGTRGFGATDTFGRSASIKYENVIGPFDFFSISEKSIEIKKSYYPSRDKFENVQGKVWPISRAVFGSMALLMNNFTMLVPVDIQENWGWRTNKSDQPGFYIDSLGNLDPTRIQIKLDLNAWDSSHEGIVGDLEGNVLWTAYIDKFLEVQSNPSSVADKYSVQATLDLASFCRYGVGYHSFKSN